MSREQSKRTILIAGMGTSPVVLTNAVWAFAHQREPVVPGREKKLVRGNDYNVSTLTEGVRHDNQR